MLAIDALAVTVAEADAYCASRGIADWTGTTEEKTAALRRGQDYIIGSYNDRWTYMEPSVDNFVWVRRQWNNDTPPLAVKYAIIEAALRELSVPFSLSPDFVLGDKKVLTEVKGIKWTPTGPGTSSSYRPTITSISLLLAGYASSIDAVPLQRA